MNPYRPPKDPDDQRRPGPRRRFARLVTSPTFGEFLAATLAAVIVLVGTIGMVLLW